MVEIEECLEPDIYSFIERWLEFTGDHKDILPARVIWAAMLQASGNGPNAQRAWGLRRHEAFDLLRSELGLMRQRMRYYKLVTRGLGMPPGYAAPCYEQLVFTPLAQEVFTGSA